MAGLNLPTLVQKVRLDADTKGAEDQVSGSMSRIGGTMTKVGVGLTAAVTVPIIGMAATSVSAASDLAESASKVGVVFEDNADQVRRFAETAATSLGISEQAALEATGTFGNLFRALGVGTGPAAEMSTSLVTLAADLASFNNANPEDVLLALRSGLLGEAEPLRQFGVSLSAARIEAEALASGLVKPAANATKVTEATLKLQEANWKAAKALKDHGRESFEYEKAALAVTKAEEAHAAATEGVVPELTAAQKAQAAYAIIQQDTALAQGDFARTSDGLANQQRILAAQFQDVKASLGEQLLPIVSKAAGFFINLLGTFKGLSPEMKTTVTIVAGLAAAMGPLLIVGGSLVKNFGLIRAAISGGSGLLGLGPLLPVVAGLAAAGYLLYRNWDKVAPIFETVKGIAGQLFDIFARRDFTGGPLAEDSPIVDTAFKIRDAIVEIIGSARQVFDVLFKGDFKGGPLSEDSPIIDGAFKVRDAVIDLADKFKRNVLPVIEDVFAFIQRNAKPIMAGLAGALLLITAPVSTVVAALVLAYAKFEGFRNVVNSVVSFLVGTVVPAIVKFATGVGTQIANLIGFFQSIAPQVREALGHVQAVIEVVFAVVKEIIQGTLGVLAALWRAWGDDLLAIGRAVFGTIQEVINGAMEVVTGIIRTVLAVINGDWGRAWDGIKGILAGAWDAIFGVLRGAANVVRGLVGGIVSVFGEVLRPLGNFLHTWIVTPFETVLGFVGGLPGRITRLASGMWDGIKNAFRGAINWIIDAWNGLEFKIPGFDPPGPGPKFGGFTLGVPNIDRLALGGRSTPGMPFIAGDGTGPELVSGEAGSAQVLSADRTERFLRQIAQGVGVPSGGGDTYPISVQTVDRPSGERLGRDIAWGIASSRGRPLAGSGRT